MGAEGVGWCNGAYLRDVWFLVAADAGPGECLKNANTQKRCWLCVLVGETGETEEAVEEEKRLHADDNVAGPR